MKQLVVIYVLVAALALFVGACSKSSGGGDSSNGNAQLTGTVQVQGASNQNQ